MADPIERWYRAALAAVAPEAAVRRHLARRERRLLVAGQQVEVGGRLVLVAVGKAAIGMSRAAVEICGDLVAGGIAITKDGHVTALAPVGITVREAAHPIPDERGVAATREMLTLLRATGPGDVVLALISGGGSALLEAPRPPLTLADMAATTDLLLRAGAPIEALNGVRVPLSLVKGGGLRAAAPAARFATLILSDVLGNDPRVIASGPTVATSFTPDGARAILERYGVWERAPAAVRQALQANGAADAPHEAIFARDLLTIVGDNTAALAAAADAAEADGRRVEIVWRERQGEAADLAREWVERCLAAPPDVAVLLGGGEATVTVRGDGTGGRNTEFALAAALELSARAETGWRVASLATDGQDALTGVAGAIADGDTVAHAAAAGIDAATALAANDSLRVFAAAGGLVAPGPTGTNVNDLYFGVRTR